MCVCFVIQLHHNNAKSPAYKDNDCTQAAASCLKQDATKTCPRRQKSKRPTDHSHCRQQQAAKHTDTISHQRTNNLKPVGHRVHVERQKTLRCRELRSPQMTNLPFKSSKKPRKLRCRNKRRPTWPHREYLQPLLSTTKCDLVSTDT